MRNKAVSKEPAKQNMLIVFCGMTASGKSTLASHWAEKEKLPYFNTDAVRKELAGLRPQDKRPSDVGQGIYSQEFTAQTYAAMLRLAEQQFAAGQCRVLLDGSYSKRSDRDQVRALANRIGGQTLFLFCHCSEAEVQRRLALRAQDADAVSDGRWEIFLHQKKTFEFPQETESSDWLELNTEVPLVQLVLWLEQRCGCSC